MIDYVYKTVQAALNKNRRGTLTPDRFNLFCRTSLNDMYSNFINEKRQYENRKSSRKGGPRKQEVDKALARYLVKTTLTVVEGKTSFPEDFGFTPDRYLYLGNTEIPAIPNDSYGAFMSGIMAPSELYPMHKVFGSDIEVYPDTISEVDFIYYRTPLVPNWTYIEIDGVPIFDPSSSAYVDIDLYEHRTEELINSILIYAGLAIKDDMSVQVGTSVSSKDDSDKAQI